jgi:hypothetical protein
MEPFHKIVEILQLCKHFKCSYLCLLDLGVHIDSVTFEFWVNLVRTTAPFCGV